MSEWRDHVERWRDCQRCPLGKQRGRICLARGTVPCEVLFLGEAPGVSEDALGLPFVGPAGHLLDAIIARALPPGMTYALTNLVACFPREAKAEGINEPERGEILECRPRLVEFVNLARPRLIVCVGKLAAHYTRHGDTVRCADIDHPAWILRLPLAQQQMATQKCVVIIRNAIEDLSEVPQSEFQQWGVDRASSKTTEVRIRDAYNNARRSPIVGTNEDDIPF